MKTITELLRERTDARTGDEIMSAARNEVDGVVQCIFDNLPEVRIIQVVGYAPHFNDGDPCEWGIATAVDYVGVDDCYYSPAHPEKESFKDYANYFNEDPLAPYDEIRGRQSNEVLGNAANLMQTLSKTFKILDNYENGTCWIFTRRQNSKDYELEIVNFDHD